MRRGLENQATGQRRPKEDSDLSESSPFIHYFCFHVTTFASAIASDCGVRRSPFAPTVR
ncbi:hypothetical protein SBBP1_560015 [Burkholderiales bacterium]|nr:hypothetical protein SBBP1_560015 [Burkholderiales bacterium]